MIDERDNEYEYTVRDDDPNFVSILDEKGSLTKDHFEQAIACGSSKDDLCVLFGKTYKEMEQWCMVNYNHLHFDEAYARILRIIRNKFLEKCDMLSDNGNASALNIMATFLLKYQDNAGSSGGITIINNIPNGKEEKSGEETNTN